MSGIVKCSAIEMSESLSMVDLFKSSGIEFIPVPVSSTVSRDTLKRLAGQQLDQLELDAMKLEGEQSEG